MNEESEYLGSLRSIVEGVFRDMLVTAVYKYDIKYDETICFADWFNNQDEIVDYLNNIGFIIEPLLDNQIEVSRPFSIKYNIDASIKNGFETKFVNTNLSCLLMSFVTMLNLSDKYVDSFDFNEPLVQGLISLIIAIMFIDRGHNQNTEFDKNSATILVEKALETLSYIYNKNGLLNWR